MGGARFLPLTVRCSIPSEELTSTTLTGVAILVPENQGTTCCLPRKLAILEDPRMRSENRRKNRSDLSRSAAQGTNLHRWPCGGVKKWQAKRDNTHQWASLARRHSVTPNGAPLKKIVTRPFWDPKFGPQSEGGQMSHFATTSHSALAAACKRVQARCWNAYA